MEDQNTTSKMGCKRRRLMSMRTSSDDVTHSKASGLHTGDLMRTTDEAVRLAERWQTVL